jgi:hypothetical protein
MLCVKESRITAEDVRAYLEGRPMTERTSVETKQKEGVVVSDV